MEEYLSPDGTVIGCRVSGQGPPLLLVHGTTADHQRWDGISPELERRFTLYALDRRGRGLSGDSADYTLEREFEDVAAAAAGVGEPVNLLAHSFGALVSLEAALLTDRIRRMVLYEPPIPTGLEMYPPDFPPLMGALIAQGEDEAALEFFMRAIVKMPEVELADYRQLPMWARRIQLAPTILREMVLDQHYQFQPEKFRDLKVPTLLLLGGDSPPLFQRAVESLHAALPDARVEVLPGQQHIAMDTAPELFLSKVLDFLQGA